MTKPVYRHPEFVTQPIDKRIIKENKRLWLSLTIDKNKKESIVVILKNPSRATKDISDKTVYTVTTYIHKNREKYKPLNNVGTVIILNLIPFYETDSTQLANYKNKIIDKDNINIINEFTSKYKNVIIAWGNPPKGLSKQYEELKNTVLNILKTNKNKIYYVDRLTKKQNPKHGQVWSYSNLLNNYDVDK